VLQPVETYKTQDGRNTVIFLFAGEFSVEPSRNYVDGLMPDKDGEPRDEMIAQFSAVRRDYGPAGVRVELGHVGILPVWSENNRNELAAGKTKTTVIRPILIDREIPKLQARLDELNKATGAGAAGASGLSEEQKKEFIEVTNRLKLMTDRRALLLARTGTSMWWIRRRWRRGNRQVGGDERWAGRTRGAGEAAGARAVAEREDRLNRDRPEDRDQWEEERQDS